MAALLPDAELNVVQVVTIGAEVPPLRCHNAWAGTPAQQIPGEPHFSGGEAYASGCRRYRTPLALWQFTIKAYRDSKHQEARIPKGEGLPQGIYDSCGFRLNDWWLPQWSGILPRRGLP
jgi:hypothetical protein